MSKAILDERAKGEFKDWPDLQTRVKGLGDKKAAKLSQSGLVVNGKEKEGSPIKKYKETQSLAKVEKIKADDHK
jgi:competence protein ComEA